MTALQAAGIPPMAGTIDEALRLSDDSEAGIANCIRTCDAIVATSDITALRVIRTARELEVTLPDELAVVAIGESPLVELVSPRVTNVVQPHAEYVRAISRILQDILQDPSAWDGRSIVTQPELVVRESSVTGDGATVGPRSEAAEAYPSIASD
jgi:DNA-binding LacI/PurR family transcriptional regulator